MNPTLKKHLITHAIAVVVFFIITLLMHYPAFFQGQQIDQHDILQGFGGNNQLKEYRAEAGEEPVWNNYLFSGMPAYLTGVRYTGDLLSYVYKGINLGMSHPAAILFISMVSFYILMLTFRVRSWIAVAAAIAFGLNGFNIIGVMAGHNAKIASVAFMPLVLAGIHLAFTGKRWIGFGLTALALGLQIKTNHPQITYYLALILAVYGIAMLISALKGKKGKDFVITSSLVVLAAVLAVGANWGRLSTILEYSSHSIRGKSELETDRQASSGLDQEYAFRYSNGIMEPLFLFVPNVFGGSSQQELSAKSEVAKALRQAGYNRNQVEQQVRSAPTYWGDQPLTAPYYAGTLTVVLFILGVVMLPIKKKGWLIVVVAMGIVMSWGKNFPALNDFLFDYLPGYNKFRSVTFTIIISIFAMNLLGFQALHELVEREWSKDTRKKLLITLGIAGGFLLMLVLFAGALGYRGAIDAQLPDWFVDAVRQDRESLLRKDALRALLFVGAASAIFWYLKRGKVAINLALIGLAFLVFVDSFSLSKRFLDSETFADDPKEDFFRETEADQVMKASINPGERVLNLQNPFNENRTSYHHESIGGYHGAKIRRYQDLIDYCISAEMQRAVDSLRGQSLDFSGLPVLNMLNTRYMYAGAQRNAVFPNHNSNGNAWFVTEVIPVNSPDEEVRKVCETDTKTQAVIDVSKFGTPQVSGSGQITLVDRTPNKITYTANVTGGNALAVFSEIYYPKGWKATIDDDQADILRANYVLRALEVPEGSHTIEFRFEPRSYATGSTVMLISSILVLLSFVGGVVFSIKNKPE